MVKESFKEDLVERRRRRAMGFREKGEQFPIQNLEREKEEKNEDIFGSKHINIPFCEITKIPFVLNVLNTTLILFPVKADMS